MEANDEDRQRCHGGVCVRLGTDGTPGLCAACADRLADWVADLPGLWVRLHLRLAKGQATGERVSGTAAAPLPAREAVLSFIGPTLPGQLDLRGDWQAAALQDGDMPLLGRLEATVQTVCEQMAVSPPRPPRLPARAPSWPYGPPSWGQVEAYRRWRETSWPHRQAAAVFDFLGRWHRWICGHPWADQYAAGVYDVWVRAKTLAGEWDPRPEPVVGVPCGYCDAMALYRTPGEDGRTCEPREGGCGRWVSDAEFARWVGMLAHWAKEAG